MRWTVRHACYVGRRYGRAAAFEESFRMTFRPALVRIGAVLLAFALLSAQAGSEAGASGDYAVTEHWKVGGAGGWDLLAVDGPGRHLFLSRSDRVMVLDATTGKSVGEIPGTEGVHGIALAADLERGFTSNGKSNSVTAFDLRTLERIKDIGVDGQNPDMILYEPVRHRVFVFNGRSGNVDVIDARTLAPVATIALEGKPELAASDARGRVFVNIEDKARLALIDGASLKVAASWSLAPCEEPTGLAIDARRERLFAVCQNETMIVVDGTDGRHVATLPIGGGPDGAVFDPSSGNVFSANGEGSLTVVHENDADHYSVTGTIATQKSARTIALDARTHRLFLPAAEFGARPEATTAQPHPRPPMIADTFAVLVVAPTTKH
jgi:YVTN family beta-propeller protein